MQLVAILIGDPGSRAAVAASLRPHAHVQTCLSRRRLLAVIRRFAVGAVVLGLRTSRSEMNAAFVSTIRQRRPDLPIIGVVRLRADDAREIVLAARAGMSDVILLGQDEPWAVVRRFLSGKADARAVVLDALATSVPTCVWPILEYCVANASTVRNVEELARAFGVPRRTLARRLSRAGLPGPATTLVWLRLLLAAHLLEHTQWKVERVAHEAGFASALTLRRQLRRLAGMKPTEARRRGSLAAMVWGSASALRSSGKERTARALAG
jgi:AraC-like DNA-binding protein